MNGNHTKVPPGIASDSPYQNCAEDLLLPRQWDANGHAKGLFAPGGYVLKTDNTLTKDEVLDLLAYLESDGQPRHAAFAGPGGDYSSPVAAAGKICVASQPGMVVVYRAGDTIDVLARNSLGETVIATPAIADGTLYVRTKNQLYAFGSEALPLVGTNATAHARAPLTGQ